MKYLKPPTVLAAIAAGLLSTVFAPQAEARIGESASTIERRIYSNGGIKYRDDVILESRSRGMPYMKYMDYMPNGVAVQIYFKTHDGRKPKSSDMETNRMTSGWDLHVLYLDGKSAMEVYKRSQSMSEFEFNQLMLLQGGSGWQRVKKPAAGEEPPPSAFGYTMETRDGSLRAKKLGADTVMFFKADIDQTLALEQLRDLQELAPRSVMGF